MKSWYGYPQDLRAHRERPWWRLVRGWWEIESVGDFCIAERSDGLTLCYGQIHMSEDGPPMAEWPEGAKTPEEALAGIDAKIPLPAPPKLVGQVWHWPETDRTCLVTGDDWPEEPPDFKNLGAGGRWTMGVPAGPIRRAPEWPPAGAVLVAGPLSPWADTKAVEATP